MQKIEIHLVLEHKTELTELERIELQQVIEEGIYCEESDDIRFVSTELTIHPATTGDSN